MINKITCLQVETTNICNAHCVFCPHDRFKEFGSMSDILYEKVITEASRLAGLQSFIPMLTGEPFCDKNIMARIKAAREVLRPEITIQLYTNGSLLSTDILKQLSLIPKLFLNISLNGLKPEIRLHLMGLDDWVHVVRMARYAQEIKLPTRVTLVAYPELHEQDILDFNKVGGVTIQYQSWAGQQYHYERKRWTSCVRALGHMTVRYDGSANLCCFDPFGKVKFGNVKEQTLEEIWGSSERQEYIKQHQAGLGNRLPLCEACTEG